ncbi:MAG: hypothetical protein LBN02_01310 [Oscillospiraceae bacterium]|jgi:hypothetical protein|nr:hypothetical protein [Oscillospiraceae bacterium]
MKKFLALLLALTLVLAFAGCASDKPANTSPTPDVTASPSPDAPTPDDPTPEVPTPDDSADVLTYAEYIAAELDSEVVIEAYVQAKQALYSAYGTTSLYTQDEDGAYFLYRIACSDADYDLLQVGTKIRVTGFKSAWAGEVEIIDATFEIIDGSYVAPAFDATALLGTDALIDYQNQFVSFKGLTVEAAGKDESGADVAFLYNWDGSGTDGDDLYFSVSLDGTTYSFTVESDLAGAGTAAYEAVKALTVGDVVDLEGFLYWYEGVNPHITAVTPAA